MLGVVKKKSSLQGPVVYFSIEKPVLPPSLYQSEPNYQQIDMIVVGEDDGDV
jgi:hypothetical protein